MKRIIILLLASTISISLFSQSFNVVPKVKSFELGTSLNMHSTYNIKPVGPNAQFDMAWQVSGFGGKAKAYISVPLGYCSYSIGGPDSAGNASLLYYGWTIRHNLSRDKAWIPFLSYSLLLDQLWLSGFEGHVIGHETRFDYGYDYKPADSKITYLFKIEYSHRTYPALGNKHSNMMDLAAFKLGIRF